MDTLLYNNELQLGRFAEYLLKQRLVPEKNAPYYVSWVRKFLARGVTVPVPPLDERVAGFIRDLEAAGSYQDWQITQAERALRLYFVNFKGDTAWSAPTVSKVTANPDGSFGRNGVIEALRTRLRVKHYAYSTEKTYLDWIQDYLGQANVETTMIYTHVVKNMRAPAVSPLDAMRRAG